MRQGEIWMSDLNLVNGSERARKRPVVILSRNLMNKFLQVVITAPLTSKIKNYHGNPIIQSLSSIGLKLESELMIFHVRSISRDRQIGTISDQELNQALETLQD